MHTFPGRLSGLDRLLIVIFTPSVSGCRVTPLRGLFTRTYITIPLIVFFRFFLRADSRFHPGVQSGRPNYWRAFLIVCGPAEKPVTTDHTWQQILLIGRRRNRACCESNHGPRSLGAGHSKRLGYHPTRDWTGVTEPCGALPRKCLFIYLFIRDIYPTRVI
jgi:hypothetical protein